MKLLILLTLTMSSLLYANDKSFEEKKQNLITRLNKKISKLQEAKDCAQNAIDEKALRLCKKKILKAAKMTRRMNQN